MKQNHIKEIKKELNTINNFNLLITSNCFKMDSSGITQTANKNEALNFSRIESFSD